MIKEIYCSVYLYRESHTVDSLILWKHWGWYNTSQCIKKHYSIPIDYSNSKIIYPISSYIPFYAQQWL
jgi:hypothetical protein